MRVLFVLSKSWNSNKKKKPGRKEGRKGGVMGSVDGQVLIRPVFL